MYCGVFIPSMLKKIEGKKHGFTSNTNESQKFYVEIKEPATRSSNSLARLMCNNKDQISGSHLGKRID